MEPPIANNATEDSASKTEDSASTPPSAPMGGHDLRARKLLWSPMRQDSVFHGVSWTLATSLLVVCILIGWALTQRSLLSIHRFGPRFLWTTTWDPVQLVFGALPFIYGTIVTSILALLIAVPLGIASAVFLAEVAPRWLSAPISFAVELLAAIPSIVYGIWGMFVLVPLIQPLEVWLGAHFGMVALFQGAPYGIGMLAAGIILSIMVLPFITAVTRDVIRVVPRSISDASFALGATRWETIRLCVLPFGKVGIIGAVILGLGRALGETMAVTMVIGNRPEISASLFNPSYTMASVLANEFSEATSDMYISALVEIGLLLFILTIIVNAIGQLLLWQVTRSAGGRDHG